MNAKISILFVNAPKHAIRTLIFVAFLALWAAMDLRSFQRGVIAPLSSIASEASVTGLALASAAIALLLLWMSWLLSGSVVEWLVAGSTGRKSAGEIGRAVLSKGFARRLRILAALVTGVALFALWTVHTIAPFVR